VGIDPPVRTRADRSSLREQSQVFVAHFDFGPNSSFQHPGNSRTMTADTPIMIVAGFTSFSCLFNREIPKTYTFPS
jgi:hypothetical protein